MSQNDARVEAALEAARANAPQDWFGDEFDEAIRAALSAADAVGAEDGRSREIWEIPEMGWSHWLAEDVPHFAREIPKTGAALLLAMDDRRVVGLRWSSGAPVSAAPSPEGET